MTQDQFAEKTGHRPKHALKAVKSYNDPQLNVLTKLSKVSGKDIDKLVKGWRTI